MKLLLDSSIWGPTSEFLSNAGIDVDWCGGWDADPGDVAILQRAHQDGCILVTLDKDFGELAVRHGHAHCGIIRLVAIAARRQGPVIVNLLTTHLAALQAGAIVTAKEDSVRVRPPDI